MVKCNCQRDRELPRKKDRVMREGWKGKGRGIGDRTTKGGEMQLGTASGTERKTSGNGIRAERRESMDNGESREARRDQGSHLARYSQAFVSEEEETVGKDERDYTRGLKSRREQR